MSVKQSEDFSNGKFEYGDLLLVVKGKHKGIVGLYDNDEENEHLVLYPMDKSKVVDYSKGYILVSKSEVTGPFLKAD